MVTGSVSRLQSSMDKYELNPDALSVILDVRDHSPVMVMSGLRANQLFRRGVDPVGKDVMMGGVLMTVIGVTEVMEAAPWWKRNLSIVPITLIHSHFTGNKNSRI